MYEVRPKNVLTGSEPEDFDPQPPEPDQGRKLVDGVPVFKGSPRAPGEPTESHLRTSPMGGLLEPEDGVTAQDLQVWHERPRWIKK